MINILHITSETLPQLFHHYGSLTLFGLLALGIFGLPIPDETLLVIAGFLIAKGQLNLFATIFASIAGSIVGITISYLLGLTLGKRLLLRFGSYIGIKKERVETAHQWFEKVGKWLLFFGYYVPGVRHLTGFIAGSAYLSFWRFVIFAYSGAILWVLTFIILGISFHDTLHHHFNHIYPMI